ncbi:UDP-glycosyltransferase 73C6-like [Dioscorea cayenensis subsp. rotundata]|uniref:Glycosyltransferase n=1 Tax=Dioscorea cayennensis subsp. rotundata TaxID=55577 RepID=A0AB40CV27_DIOCR|nr:UDP-glycosyltransferase 73C6-like [Dioscorea cayenensis subsp. rotundata]
MTNQTVIPLSQNSGNVPNPHFVLVPLMAQGHMIPMIDMVRLIASRGVHVTFVTTPINAARNNTSINSMHGSGLPIHFLTLPFPGTEAGLPEGCENLDTLPSRALIKNFLDACRLLKDPLINHLKAQSHLPPPSLIITDLSHPWTREVSKELSIPRLFFNGFGCFALLCSFNIRQHKIHETITDENELFVIPGMPDRIELTRAQAPGFFYTKELEKYTQEVREAEIDADGVVVNSFDELESPYCEWYQKTTGKKAWMIGPLSLSNKNVADVAARGNKAAIDESLCMSWLDSMKPSSVLYVSFGSMARTKVDQLLELGLALEASEKPFVWVIKAGEKMAEVEKWLSEGFEERTRSRGLIIRGWAPQVTILSHQAVGGFMTHCGWNSTLEGVTAGVPMITWPHFAEQFINEKLIVQVLKIGVSVGVKHPTKWGDDNGDAVLLEKERVEKAVATLMAEGEEAEEMRKRAKVLGEMAGRAMEEGGSSYQNLSNLIQCFNGADHGQVGDKKNALFA